MSLLLGSRDTSASQTGHHHSLATALCVHCRTNDPTMLVFKKILTGGNPAASLACQHDLFVLDRAIVFPAFPEDPGLFLVPGEDQDVGGKRAMDLYLLTLY